MKHLLSMDDLSLGELQQLLALVEQSHDVVPVLDVVPELLLQHLALAQGLLGIQLVQLRVRVGFKPQQDSLVQKQPTALANHPRDVGLKDHAVVGGEQRVDHVRVAYEAQREVPLNAEDRKVILTPLPVQRLGVLDVMHVIVVEP